jgi:hypothetical protein
MDALRRGPSLTRLRWRLRGALTWPLFVALTALEAVALHLWPVAGGSTSIIGAFLFAGFVNLIAVAAVAPLLARAVRRRSGPVVPLEVVTDRVAARLLVGVALLFAVGAAVNHSSVVAGRSERDAMKGAVYRVVEHQYPRYRTGLARVDVDKPAPHLFRACVPGSDPHRALCLYVRTDESPPGVIVDADHTPNSVYFGTDRRDG